MNAMLRQGQEVLNDYFEGKGHDIRGHNKITEGAEVMTRS